MQEGIGNRQRLREYDEAESHITTLLKDAQGGYLAHKLVARLRQDGIPANVGSTAMWEMIGVGQLELSDHWFVSLAEDQAVALAD